MYNILTDSEITRLFSIFKDTQESFIQKLYKALPDIIYVLNLENYGIIYCSRLIALEIGYSQEEAQAMSHPIFDILHPEDREKFIQHLEVVKSSAAGEVIEIEYRLIRRDGKIAWYNDRDVVFTRKANGEAHTKIGINHDITERKEYEERLIRNENIIVETEILADSGSWEYEHTSKSFTWSKGMYRLFGLPEEMPVHPSIYNKYAVEKDRHIAERIIKGIEDTDSSFEELLRIGVDGEVRHLKIKASPINGNQLHDKTMIGVDIDLSGIEQKQEDLRRLNAELMTKNRMVELLHSDLKTLTDVAAADISTNLKNLYTAFEFIITREAGHFSDNGKALARKMQGTMQKLNLLTNDILTYLQIQETGEDVQTVSLDHTVELIIAEFSEVIAAAGIRIEKGSLGYVKGNVHLIYILLRHLIDNAIKFRKPDQQQVITISSSYSSGEGGSSEPQTLKLVIHDTGIGVKPGDRENIFLLFFKNHDERKTRGSGIGLTVARKIMSIHNGTIISEANVDDGATFVCYFPAVNEES